MKVLIVGGGGREHALAWKIAQSPHCDALYAAPGNPGIAELAECLPVSADKVAGIVRAARKVDAGLVVVGPEAPLAAGVADALAEAKILTFGPTAAGARIESSKGYARELMQRHGVPGPTFARFRDRHEAARYLAQLAAQGHSEAVVKADGLAAGKGVLVCDTLSQARQAVRRVMVERAFGRAGAEIVIEERLHGEEASLLVVTDGERLVPFLPAQDYKRVGEGDTGPNTGGMGAYAPAPLITPDDYQEALERIARPTLAGLAQDGVTYRGCLYAGVMKTPAGLRLIEFNCRFGDPETQAVLPLLESDLLEILLKAAQGDLSGVQASWSDRKAVCVVVASGGYPGDFEKGFPIEGLSALEGRDDVLVFQAGTARDDGNLVTAGGRVLNVVGLGDTFKEATVAAYAAIREIQFEDMYYREDIAARVAGQQ